MKFLADENFPKPLIIKIRQLGHSVKTIQLKNLQGSSDQTVASIAIKEKRIVLTFDKDFLEDQLPQLQAIIFHFPKTPTSEITPLMGNFLDALTSKKSSQIRILKFSKHGLDKVSY